MRTLEEISVDIRHAERTNDSDALLRSAAELDSIGTLVAEASASSARGWAHLLRGDYTAALKHYQRALSLYEELDDPYNVARATGNIGTVYRHTGDYAASLQHYDRTLEVFEGISDRVGIAGVLVNIGKTLEYIGDFPAALEHSQRALALYQELSDRVGMAVVMDSIGTVLMSTGDYPAALEHFHRAMALHEELGNRTGIAATTANIGGVLYRTDNYPAALEHFHRALVLHEELGNRNKVAIAIGNIGLVYNNTGDYPTALETFHRALALHEELGDRSGVAKVACNIGIVHGSMGDQHTALEFFRRALALHEELGERSGVARVVANMIQAYLAMNSDADAQALLQTLDALQIDDPGVRMGREFLRADLQVRSGDLDGAGKALQYALSEARVYGLRSEAATAHKALRDLAQMRNDFAGYIEHNNEFTRITEEINGKETATKLAMQAKQREIDAVQREHQKHMAVLHSTLPKHIADRVARGETVNDQHESAVVIFLDIVGFTSISDRVPSGHVVHLLEQVFTTLDTVCKKHGVIKIKTIGDSYMAVAFSNTQNQTPNTRHVVSAGLCAVEMLSALNALEITMPPELGDTSWTKDIGDIQVRIGMHCGPVTAGVIGTERMQYDVWGDTVNTASRMESHGEPGRIHVSEAFATALRSENRELRTENDPSPHPPVPLSLHQRGTIDIKGKGPMTTFWLEGAT